MPSESFVPSTSAMVAFEELPAAILVLDDSQRIVQWSAMASRLLGLSQQHYENSFSLLLPRGTVPHWTLAVNTLHDRGEWCGELNLVTTTGEELRVEVRAVNRSSPGQTGWVLNLEDQSARLNFERAFRRAWQRRTAERVAIAAAAELRAASRDGDLRAWQLESMSLASDPVSDATEDHDFGSILVVGGGPLGRECLRLLLEARGYTVHTATDGFEAVDQLVADHRGVRAVVIDADLPGWGTTAAIISLRQQDPLLPIVLLGTTEGKRIPSDLHVVVPKPYRLDDVLWAISECRHARV